jgi:hypothetical protein
MRKKGSVTLYKTTKTIYEICCSDSIPNKNIKIPAGVAIFSKMIKYLLDLGYSISRSRNIRKNFKYKVIAIKVNPYRDEKTSSPFNLSKGFNIGKILIIQNAVILIEKKIK